VPAPGEIVAAVVIGLVALLSLRLVIAVPGWVRLGRRPETRAIRVVGVGGGGSNAVDRMVQAGIRGVSFVALNTDAQALRRSTADSKIRIGDGITGGLGSGGDPEIGRRAAEEDEGRIARSVTGADLVFVTAGLGGGTGSGAAPIVAANARKQGALTIAVVTKPFGFEGTQRRRIAEAAAAELGANVDALIVVPNERVSDVLPEDVAMLDAFGHVDDILLQAVQGIIDLITAPGLINLDFADIRSVMTDAGPALIGLGRGRGEHRAADAARHAIASPLLEASIEGARGLLFNVSGPADLRLREVRQAAEAIREHADPDANVIFGASFNESLGEDVLITLIATGLNKHEQVRPTRPSRAEVRPVEAEARPVEAEVRPVEVELRPVVEVKPAPTPAPPPATPEPHADPVVGSAQHIRPRSAAGADVSEAGTRRSKRATEDDLEVPSFLRRRG
jgi:cell division protein FtsZ